MKIRENSQKLPGRITVRIKCLEKIMFEFYQMIQTKILQEVLGKRMVEPLDKFLNKWIMDLLGKISEKKSSEEFFMKPLR